jgi:NADPH-dependent 2,4-dienoyl-CoA reductase/sulfur reductase-like enzyme/rhodanese-related sulfurtransferase
MKVVIVGGVAGGMSAAARLRRNGEDIAIRVFEKGPYVSFANCGLPYHIGDVIAERDALLLQTPESFKARFNVDVSVGHEVVAIHPSEKTVRVRDLCTGREFVESYDKLVLSPGAEPIRPRLPGIESNRIFVLRNIPDTDKIKGYIQREKPRRALVVGAGFIGLEMAENLRDIGLEVTIVEAAPQVLGVLDFEMAAFAHHELQSKGVRLYCGDSVVGFVDEKAGIRATLASGTVVEADFVVMSIGVRPDSGLAQSAGLRLGERGGIWVDEFLRTSDSNIYAVGDAIEVRHLVSNRYGPIPLAGPANKQGRLVADNIAYGDKRTFAGAIGTSIAKIFDLAAGATGLSERLLKVEKIPYLSCIVHAGHHAGYYPGASILSVKLLFAPDTGTILGAQVVGRDGVDRRLDLFSLAIQKRMTVRDLEEFEHTYAPPFSSAKDPANLVGYVAANVLADRLRLVSWNDVAELRKAGAALVDVRTPGEFAHGRIEGAVNVPVDELRQRLGELPRDKKLVVYCGVGLRAYVACRILVQSGFTDVVNLTGGYRTYATATSVR